VGYEQFQSQFSKYQFKFSHSKRLIILQPVKR
jgi:hypothetical protein